MIIAPAFGKLLRVESQNPPHSAATWERIADLWMMAKNQNTRLLAQDLTRMAPHEIASQIQVLVDNLEKVQPGTTSYEEAQALLTYANQKLAELRAAAGKP